MLGKVATNLISQWRRHFFLLRYDRETPEGWQVETDNHRSALFWAPLNALPTIVAPQCCRRSFVNDRRRRIIRIDRRTTGR